MSILSHTSPDPGFGEFRARFEFQELPKIIIQTTLGLGREGPGYNPALMIQPVDGSKPLHSLKHEGWLPLLLLLELSRALNRLLLEEKAKEQQQPEVQ